MTDPTTQALGALNLLTTLYYADSDEWSAGSDRIRDAMATASAALFALDIPDADLDGPHAGAAARHATTGASSGASPARPRPAPPAALPPMPDTTTPEPCRVPGLPDPVLEIRPQKYARAGMASADIEINLPHGCGITAEAHGTSPEEASAAAVALWNTLVGADLRARLASAENALSEGAELLAETDARLAAVEAERDALQALLDLADAKMPVADSTCDEPGISFVEALRREAADESAALTPAPAAIPNADA